MASARISPRGVVRQLGRLIDRAALPFRARRAAAGLRGFQPPHKLHVGCGSVRLDSWVNTDYYAHPGVVDLVWDAARPMPLPAGSCAFIYHEHFLEHLSVAQAQRFLADCRRLLAPGGVLRVAMPSLSAIVARYGSDDWREQEWLSWPEHRHIRTRAEMLNVALRWWGHQWLYDEEELERRLRDAGFTQVRFVERGASEHPELRGLERRPDSLLVCEAAP